MSDPGLKQVMPSRGGALGDHRESLRPRVLQGPAAGAEAGAPEEEAKGLAGRQGQWSSLRVGSDGVSAQGQRSLEKQLGAVPHSSAWLRGGQSSGAWGEGNLNQALADKHRWVETKLFS